MSTTQQAKLHPVVPYELGDCLRDTSARGDSTKLILSECPLCRTDPTRPRYWFGEHESRPKHIHEVHGR
jgi:hypothetical protein